MGPSKAAGGTGELRRIPFVRPAPKLEAVRRAVAATDEVAIGDSCLKERVGDLWA